MTLWLSISSSFTRFVLYWTDNHTALVIMIWLKSDCSLISFCQVRIKALDSSLILVSCLCSFLFFFNKRLFDQWIYKVARFSLRPWLLLRVDSSWILGFLLFLRDQNISIDLWQFIYSFCCHLINLSWVPILFFLRIWLSENCHIYYCTFDWRHHYSMTKIAYDRTSQVHFACLIRHPYALIFWIICSSVWVIDWTQESFLLGSRRPEVSAVSRKDRRLLWLLLHDCSVRIVCLRVLI